MKTSVHLDKHTTNFEYQLYCENRLMGVERPAFIVMRLNQLHDEIERLRALVHSLRWPLAVYVHAHQTGNSVPPHSEARARAALEAKP